MVQWAPGHQPELLPQKKKKKKDDTERFFVVSQAGIFHLKKVSKMRVKKNIYVKLKDSGGWSNSLQWGKEIAVTFNSGAQIPHTWGQTMNREGEQQTGVRLPLDILFL